MALFFDGFMLKHSDRRFFDTIVPQSDYCVAGFSYGAQKALEYALESQSRIDRVVLISPAFFNNASSAFVRTQLRYFKQNFQLYKESFVKNINTPNGTLRLEELADGQIEQLQELLTYRWESKKLERLKAKGVVIEIFLGAKDGIIDAEAAKRFFEPLGVLYYYNKAGHTLEQ